MITAIYDDTKIHVADKDGAENYVDCLNLFESMVLRIDIPGIIEQYLGFWVDGEYFTYDINQEAIDVVHWTYLIK